MTIRVKYIDGTYDDFESGKEWEVDDFVDILGEDEEGDEIIIANINSGQIRAIIDLDKKEKDN
jgi:hypothetical protein